MVALRRPRGFVTIPAGGALQLPALLRLWGTQTLLATTLRLALRSPSTPPRCTTTCVMCSTRWRARRDCLEPGWETPGLVEGTAERPAADVLIPSGHLHPAAQPATSAASRASSEATSAAAAKSAFSAAAAASSSAAAKPCAAAASSTAAAKPFAAAASSSAATQPTSRATSTISAASAASSSSYTQPNSAPKTTSSVFAAQTFRWFWRSPPPQAQPLFPAAQRPSRLIR